MNFTCASALECAFDISFGIVFGVGTAVIAAGFIYFMLGGEWPHKGD